MFKEEGRVLASEIDDAKTTFSFWFAAFFSRQLGASF